MKEIICTLLLGVSVLASCTKEQTTTTPKVRQLSYEMKGNSMYSKAVNSTDVLNAINAALPEKLDIVLTSQANGKVFTGKTNEGIVLPSDTYSVIGSCSGTPTSGTIIMGKSAYLASSPKVSVSQSLTITDEECNYTLNGSYSSFALVVDSEEVEKAYVTTLSGEEEIQFITSGESKITFGQGDYSSVYLQIRVIPIDKDRYKETTFTLSTAQRNGIGFIEYGKYYVIHPTTNGKQPKLVALDLPAFVEGTI